MSENKITKSRTFRKYLTRKRFIGLILGLVLAIIVLNVDKKLWFPLELETLNGRNATYSKNAFQDAAPKSDVVVILFDDKTRFLLRQNGMPIRDFEKRGRDLIRIAIEKLEAYKVRSIGINLNLNGTFTQEVDNKLAQTISLYRNIVIADSIYSFTNSGEKILKSATAVGFGELFADYDKIVHKITIVDRNFKNVPSFSYALYKISYKKDIPIKLKEKNEFYLRYRNNLINKFSFIDLIQGKIPPKALKDKVIIIGNGLNSKLSQDGILNPFNKKTFTSDSEVQALSIYHLVNNSFLFKFGLNNYPIAFILLSMFLGTLFSSLKTVRRLSVGAIILIGAIFYSQLAYNYYQAAIEIIPVLFLILGNLIIGSFIFLQLDLQEQNIELEHAFNMLTKRSEELGASKVQLQKRNIQLTGTLTELNERVAELKEVRKQLSSKSEDERKRIARELHDDTLARITDVKRHIESIINSRDLPLTPKKELGACIQTMDNITHEIRRIINALRPSMLDNVLGLIPAIENLLDELTKRSNHKIQTKLTTSISNLKLPEMVEINLYRIIQEALNNVYKHSGATKVEIVIEEQPGQILFLVIDNGGGFPSDMSKKGFGLIDMKERAELIGAKIQSLNRPEKTGVAIEIALPLNTASGRKPFQKTT